MRYYWSVLLIVLLCSCQSHYTKNKTILKAEALLNTKPESSFLLLTSIREPQKLSEADYAAWCLHYTYAQYKLKKYIKSDSLIRIAVSYFEEDNYPKYSGTSYFLLGYFNKSHNKNKEALVYLKEAEKILKGTTEINLNGLVAYYIGSICSRDELYNHSLKYFKKSAYYFQRSKDLKSLAYAYREISNMYDQLNYRVDSTMYYSKLALKYSKESNDYDNYYSTLLRQGVLIRDRDYSRSKEYLLEGIKFVPLQKKYYAAYIAYAYSRLDMNDSAQFYLKISLTDTVNSPYKIIGLHAASLIAENRNDYKTAYLYLEKSYLLRDSTYEENSRSQLYRIDRQYDSTQKEKENAQLRIDKRTLAIWVTLSVILAMAIFILFLIFRSRSKKKQTQMELENQRLHFDAETIKIQNTQKREVLRVKLVQNITNTLEFNDLRKTYQQSEKQSDFYAQLAKQSMLTEGVWQHYIDQTNSIFDNRIEELKMKHTYLSKTDLIVIALICLKVSILNSFVLLGMSKATIYKRRKTIKKRLNLGADIDLETWILENINLEVAIM